MPEVAVEDLTLTQLQRVLRRHGVTLPVVERPRSHYIALCHARNINRVDPRLPYYEIGVESFGGITLGGHSTVQAVRQVHDLGSADWDARLAAGDYLQRLDPSVLTQQRMQLVELLDDGDWDVRRRALECLRALPEPARSAPILRAVAARLDDDHSVVRQRALDVISELPPEALEAHVGALLRRLADADDHVRQGSADCLCRLEPTLLVRHAKALAAHVSHPRAGVRDAALGVMVRLPPDRFKAEVVGRLSHAEPDVRRRALEWLGQLGGDFCAPHVGALLERLGDTDAAVRKAAAAVLAAALGARDAANADGTSGWLGTKGDSGATLGPRLADGRGDVRYAALECVGSLPDASLDLAAPTLLPLLGRADVRHDALVQGSALARAVASAWEAEMESVLDDLAEVLVTELSADDEGARRSAAACFGKLPADVRARHIVGALDLLHHPEVWARLAGIQFLVAMGPAQLTFKLRGQIVGESYGSRLVTALGDVDDDVRIAALEALGRLPPADLEQEAADEIERVVIGAEGEGFFGGGAVAADTSARVRAVALGALSRLSPRVLARRAATLVAALADGDAEVRRRALVCAEIALPLAPTAADGPLLGATAACLGDGSAQVRRAALKALASLPPRALAAHHRALRERAADDDSAKVRAAAAEMVDALEAAAATEVRRAAAACAAVLGTPEDRAPIGEQGEAAAAAKLDALRAALAFARETGADGGHAVEADAVLQTARRRVGGGLAALWKWMSEGDMLSKLQEKRAEEEAAAWEAAWSERRPSLLKLLTTERLVAEAAQAAV